MAKSALRRIIGNPLETEAQRMAQAIPTPVNRNFVRRYMMPENFPAISNPDGTVSTHRMASAEVDGRNIAYPTIIQDPATGKLTQLDDDQAFDYALRNNEYLTFPDQQSAQAFSEGGYKSNGMNPPRNMQQERMDARRARIGMEPYVRQAQTKTAGQAMADMLGGLAVPTGFIPGIGDATGLAADAAMYAAYPEERTMLNAGMSLAGLVPFVPGAAVVRAAEGALDMSQAARMQRANEFGGEANWYRGSAIDEGDELSKKFLGENTNAPSARRGFFFASNPETASSPSYATMSGDVISDYVQARFKQLTGRKNPPEDSMQALKYLAEEATKPIVDEKFKKGFDALYNTDYQLKNELEESLIGYIKKLAESDDEYYLNKYSKYINEVMSHRDDGAGEISDELKRMVFENIPEIERVTTAISERDNIYDALKASSRLDPKWARSSEGAPDSIFDNAELGANVGQYKLNMQNPYIHDMGGSGYRETSYDEILANALSGGHDSAIIKNTYDGGKQLTDIGVIFEPNQARSIYADFNPAKRSSANLSAGIVGGAVGLSALRNINQQEEK